MTRSPHGRRPRPRLLRMRRILDNQVRAFRDGGVRANAAAFARWRAARLPKGEFSNGVRVLFPAPGRARVRPTREIVAVAVGGGATAPEGIRLLPTSWTSGDPAALRRILQEEAPGADALLLVPGERPPNRRDVILMQSALDDYARDDGRIAAVTPRLVQGDGRADVCGFEWDAAAREWCITPADPEFDRTRVPRYVLAAPVHGLLIHADALADVQDAPARSVPDARTLIRQFWTSGWRTLALPAVAIESSSVVAPVADDLDLQWRHGRADRARTADGSLRIVYVLKATSVSGGIRTVFEQSEVLRAAGHDVEIWSLQGEPDWIENRVPLRTFATLADLRRALEDSDAIAVATWWETAETVWLATVDRGLPVYYVQEFETWFYPDDALGRAAVASSYRREMHCVTIADYQRDELARIGVAATTISSAYSPEKFRLLDGVERSDDTVLAVGRSFFQKNFAMTAAAWAGLPQPRPPLRLFGFEPELADDAGIEYVVRPSDVEVNRLYNEAACFVQTSLHEGFCLPILEAMAAGCPVITTDSHGNRDFCVPGENCVQVEQHDVEGLSAAIRTVLDDAALRSRLREAGLRTAASHTWPVITQRLVDHFGRLDLAEQR